MRSSSRSEVGTTGHPSTAAFPSWIAIWRAAGQDVRRRIARVFVCTAGEADAVLGFYTLSALSIDLASLPEQLSRKLPRHPVPCALIGRLAVDRSAHGRGLGRMLLADAVKQDCGQIYA